MSETEAEVFAAAFLKTGSATNAMRALRPHLAPASARSQACHWMKRPEVKAAIERMQKKLISDTILSVEEGLTLLTSMARGEVNDPETLLPIGPAGRLAALRLLGVWRGWEGTIAAAKNTEDNPNSLLARIRTARPTLLDSVQDAEIVNEKP